MKHTLSVLVEDESGALSRIAGLFARRGFNIDSLAVGPAEAPGISRLTMVVEANDLTLQQMTKQLDKLVNVLQVLDLTRIPAVERELMLVTVAVEPEHRDDIVEQLDRAGGKVMSVGTDSMMLSLVGDPDHIDAFENLLRPFGILEIQRTGRVALANLDDTIE